MTQQERHTLDRRTRFLALLIGVPAVVATLGIGASEIWRWFRPDSRLFVRPAAASRSDTMSNSEGRADSSLSEP